MVSIRRRSGYAKPKFCAVPFVLLGTCLTQPALADACRSTRGASSCFDANSLWLPAGKAEFLSLPDTHVNAPKQLSIGFATELLHGPVTAHVASPDSSGRDVRVVDYALDASLFVAVGAFRHFAASLTLPTRLYQNGAGTGGLTSQSAPAVGESAARDPRLGVAYSLDDLLGPPDIGLRLALDVSLPLGGSAALAGERSLVGMPSATFGARISCVALRASLGARLRQSVNFADVRLGNQGFVALGLGVDILDPGLLFLSIEGFALPPLTSSRGGTANASVTDVSLVPAEWLLAVSTSFRGGSEWSLSASAGTGLPLSSETTRSSSGAGTSYFLGLTEPEWRSIIAVRFTPE